MQLFVGLGNPGQQYQMNRHNIGFMAVDKISIANSFSPWRSKFQGLFCEGQLGTQKVIVLKPSTFMNLSGQSVGEISRFYKINSQNIVVFHDELDLAPGKCRFKSGGGHAGHNGLKSIHSHIGENYKRVRLGIGHPGQKDLVSKYVLQDFQKRNKSG
jgi:PTH1 family peptidyl-tRNA hydrolase